MGLMCYRDTKIKAPTKVDAFILVSQFERKTNNFTLFFIIKLRAGHKIILILIA